MRIQQKLDPFVKENKYRNLASGVPSFDRYCSVLFIYWGKSDRRKMAMAGLYRRVLPSPPAIDFASNEGKVSFLIFIFED